MNDDFSLVISEELQMKLRNEILNLAKAEINHIKNDLILEDKYLNQEQLMKSLKIGKTTIDNMIADGLPVICLGNKKLFDKKDIQNYLNKIKI